MSDDDVFNIPADLTGLSEAELAALRERATAEFDALYSSDSGPTTNSVARATELADSLDRVGAEESRRTQVAADWQAQRDRVDGMRQAAMTEPPEPEPTPAPEPTPPTPTEPAPEPTPTEPVGEPALVADGTPQRGRTDVRDVIKRPSLNARLADAAAQAPNPQVPQQRLDDLVITAATATAGMPIGQRFGGMDTLVAAINSYAKGTPITNGAPNYVPLAAIQSHFDLVLSDRTGAAEVEEKLKELTNPQVLTAAGGWCTPSMIRYDFFNIACEDGRVDLPTFGVERGGIKFPVSPSLADVYSPVMAPFGGALSNATVPWLWTETDDILAVTGAGSKPCIRVPCASFSEARLEAYGICLTAGNLTDAAYPEATKNFLALLMSAYYRAISTRYINAMVALSTLSSGGGMGAAGAGTVAPLLGSVEMAAVDYRARYGMCDTAILEVKLPSWAKGVIRSDLAKRMGSDIEVFEVTDAMIAAWFDLRGVSVQFISDWQVRASGFPGFSTPMTAWPTTVEFLIYAAGTFVLGNGMSLDLGVVRDSTLNAKNDHTAAWMEETHLIAKIGHESRRYSVNICSDGTTGAADLTACGP